ncbi:hypothetical protein DYB37_011713 [Aphanomyces astaci]|uniref:START domain-containing protein n=1 Tax=Aphanomyces astaci TaxID=112090 RepID=A0A3R7BD38_APHAT|nr:hypothetical protein DYB35_010410 [Aphanomyces astaci]RHZ11126.1 hypothetical protein DYB37_011713 [Aphanomyces astaci]
MTALSTSSYSLMEPLVMKKRKLEYITPPLMHPPSVVALHSPTASDDFDFEAHPLYHSLSHIKTKRVKELEFYKRHIYDLQGQIETLKRCQTSLLPWEDIAQALKDDTLDKVRDNRSLKKEVEHNHRMYGFLKRWIASINSPRSSVPHAFQDSWRQSTLFAGDDASRHVGITWVIRHMHRNADRALAHLVYPDEDDEYVDVEVVEVHEGVLETRVMHQFTVQYGLEDVSQACYVAEKTFAQFYLQRDFDDNYTALVNEGQDIEYAREEVGPANQSIADYLIQGRFHEDNRTMLCLKTVMDEAHPLDDTTWTVNTKQWLVADRTGPTTTRVRTYYTIEHPSTQTGFVPVEEVANVFNVDSDSAATAVDRLKDRQVATHTDQRKMYAVHLMNVLENFTSTPSPSSPSNIIKPETTG